MSFTGEIINCYDSHCHFMGAGQVSLTLNLRDLKSIADLHSIHLQPEYFLGDWLVGFGWDQSHFTTDAMPNRFELDKVFSKFPVALTRADGHAILLNSYALNLLGMIPAHLQSQVEIKEGQPTGLFFEQAKEWAEKIIPQPSLLLQKAFLKEACQVYNQVGVTHIRDMTTTEQQWNLEIELLEQNSLSLFVEHLFYCENPDQIGSTVRLAQKCRMAQNSHMKVEGIKIFIDGSLGSKTAYLSKPYLGTESHGLLLWSFADIQNAITEAWRADLAIAIHAIGDAASLVALKAALEVKSMFGLNGWLAIEHAEILADEAIAIAKKLNVRFHFQPCHYLTDSLWLKHHVEPTLLKGLFRWQDLERNGMQVYFGTDCPVEVADPMRNFLAIEKSQLEGIPRPIKPFFSYHQCPNFVPSKKSFFENSKLIRIVDIEAHT